MPDSDIVCSGLNATSGVGQVVLAWTVSDPNANGLPYLALDAVEVWAALTNDRAGASKVAEGSTSAIHAGVPEEQSRFYWIKARTLSGLYGEWFPVSATGGVQGTATTATIIRAGLIEGGTIRTAESGRRVEITEITNAMTVFDSDGEFAGRFGQFTDGGIVMRVETAQGALAASISHDDGVALQTYSASNTALNGISGGSQPTAVFTSAGSGAALKAVRGSITGEVARSGFAFYAVSGGYGPFTGSHEGLWPRDVHLPEIGDIVADLRIIFRNGVSDALAEMQIAVQGGAPAIGVFAGEVDLRPTAAMPVGMTEGELSDLTARYRLIIVNALGEGQINVCAAGGPIMAGDLLCASPVPGKAMRQADDIVRSTTVARAREAADGRSQLACIYLAG